MKEIKRISCRQYSLVPKWCEKLWPNAGFKELIAHCEDVDIICSLCLWCMILTCPLSSWGVHSSDCENSLFKKNDIFFLDQQISVRTD